MPHTAAINFSLLTFNLLLMPMKPVVQIPASSYAEDDGKQSITLEVFSQISKHDPWQFTLFINHTAPGSITGSQP